MTLNGMTLSNRIDSERPKRSGLQRLEEMNMKKIFVCMMAAAVVFTIGAAGVSAAGRGNGNGQGAGYRYVDADGDGICDNRGTGYGFIDENGDGICDHQGAGCKAQNGKGMGCRNSK